MRNVHRMVAKPRISRASANWFGKYVQGVETEYEYSLDHGNTWSETTASNAHHQNEFYGRPVRFREVTPWKRMKRDRPGEATVE